VKILAIAATAVLLLAGCQGGERMNKWSSAPAPNNNPAMSGPQDPNPELKCLNACKAKADDGYAKCLVNKEASQCKDKLGEQMLECNDKCGVH
jgi:hypothetical protein